MPEAVQPGNEHKFGFLFGHCYTDSSISLRVEANVPGRDKGSVDTKITYYDSLSFRLLFGPFLTESTL
jgi:hypothetical protein